ncbi:MAG: thiamine pyrophosphate-dependent enzyme [Thermoplasmata archaeon]
MSPAASTTPPPLPLPARAAEIEALWGSRAQERAREVYTWMALSRAMDARMQALQRQGRIGFYGAAMGHEAVNISAGLLTRPEDWIFPGLREQLVALVRGHPIGAYVHHLFATERDPARGRQMPCHPTAREVHYVSMSSVIGTQITHAAGAAFAMRRRREAAVALACFGDGATSASDFHAGLNFAGVGRWPVVFLCANNQWAISMPAERQSAVERLSDKASAYGFPGRTVDGTDLFAVWAELARAIETARTGGGPTLLEMRVFRMTPHSSSDDPSRYQPPDWSRRALEHDPVRRFVDWLDRVGWLTAPERATIEQEADRRVREAIAEAERTPPPGPATLFEDVMASPTSPPRSSGGAGTG